MAHLGRTSGRLFSISTAGSIVGTFVTAFVLIPEFGTNQLLAQAAAVLFAAVAIYALAERLPVATALAVIAAVVAGGLSFELAPEQTGQLSARRRRATTRRSTACAATSAPGSTTRTQGFDVRYRKDTRYHGLAVVDDQDSRYLRFDSSFQSGMWLKRPFATRFEYTDYFSLGLAYNPDARNVLFIGLGGASAPKRMWRDFPFLHQQVVELDPVVVDVAYKYFAMPRSPRLDVDVDDGRRYLTRDDRRWDVIGIDAFYSDSIPFHLTTVEFLELVREPAGAGRPRDHERDRRRSPARRRSSSGRS